MSRRASAAAGALCWVAVTALAASTNAPRSSAAGATVQAEPAQQADAPEAFTRVCGRCHSSDRIVEGRRSRGQWEEVLEQMTARGATGTDDDYGIIIEYLVSEYGRVAINNAAADELAQVLHLDRKDADAIVAYRKGHGRFADFDALINMPDAPVEALRKRRDGIVF